MHSLPKVNAILHCKLPVFEVNFSQHRVGGFFWFYYQSTYIHQKLSRSWFRKTDRLNYRKIQIEVGQFSLSSSELSSTWNLFNVIIKLLISQCKILLEPMGHDHVEQISRGLNSLLLTKNWQISIWIFSVSRPVSLSESRSTKFLMNRRRL